MNANHSPTLIDASPDGIAKWLESLKPSQIRQKLAVVEPLLPNLESQLNKGMDAHDRVTGWTTLSSNGYVETYRRGSVQKTIVYVFENGNLVRRIE